MTEWIGTSDVSESVSAFTVADIIESARYDLRDFNGQKFDETQLLNYVNRIMKLLDEMLIVRDSDFTMYHASATLEEEENTATAPTRTNSIVLLYIDTNKIIKEPLADVMHRYQMNKESSNTGEPSYWAYRGNNIYFNIEADDDYTLDAYYHKKTAELTADDDMPYNDFFNEYIREGIVSMAEKARDNKVAKIDAEFYNMFKHIVDSATVGRNFSPKNYHIGF